MLLHVTSAVLHGTKHEAILVPFHLAVVTDSTRALSRPKGYTVTVNGIGAYPVILMSLRMLAW